jgi:hypothetical protein
MATNRIGACSIFYAAWLNHSTEIL